MQMADMKNQTQLFLENLIQLKTFGRIWSNWSSLKRKKKKLFWTPIVLLYPRRSPLRHGVLFFSSKQNRNYFQNFVFRICGKNISELVFGIFSKCYANTRSLTTAAKLSSSMKAEFVKTWIVGLWMKIIWGSFNENSKKFHGSERFQQK